MHTEETSQNITTSAVGTTAPTKITVTDVKSAANLQGEGFHVHIPHGLKPVLLRCFILRMAL